MSTYADRLKALREQLKAEKLDGFVVPLTDEHMSEYVGSYAQRLAWLTGFQGSAGSAVVLPEQAAIFVDGRYTLQVRQQVSATEWSYQSVPETSTTQWLEEHAPEGARIGYDPWLHTRDWVKKAKEALATRGAELVPVDRNPIDEIWKDRPEASMAHLVVQPDQYAGKSAAEKRTEVGDWLVKHHADAAVLSALDSIAWAFNIRGADVTHTPVALAYALVYADGTADLFVASEKIGPDVRQHLGNGVRLHERSEFENAAIRGSRARRSSSILNVRSQPSSTHSRRPMRRSCRFEIQRSFPRRSRTRPKSPVRKLPRPATGRQSPASSTGSTIRRPTATSTN